MGHPKITHSPTFADRPIYQGSFGNREEILTAVVQMFDYMWQACHHRLCVGHLTVNMPLDREANDLMTCVLKSWRRSMLHRKIRAEYVWGREIGDRASGGHPHFHIFVILSGRHIQTIKRVCDHFNQLLSQRLGRKVNLAHINPPNNETRKVWAKQVSTKRGNLDDAINWVSYVSKCDTKSAPHGQRTYGFSKGFLKYQSIADLSPSEENQEEIAFEEEDLTMDDLEWETFGNLNWEDLLNFDPLTGGPKYPKETRTRR